MTSRVTPPSQQSRYLTALKRTSAASALLVLPLAACSNNDEAIFATADSSTTSTDTATPATTTDTTAEAETTITTLDGATTVLQQTTTPAATEGSFFPSGAELLVEFTFEAAADGGRVNNPYIAVWVEDTDGNLVKTISLWALQSQKGEKWLTDLQRWASVSGATADDSVSGATKVAGSYTVAWDGTDDDGNTVSQGEYVLNIEAAREHGPYELISEPIVVSDKGFAMELTPNGELTAASATLSV